MLAETRIFRLYRYPYEDECEHFGLFVSSGHNSAYTEFYAANSDLEKLGQQLEGFPENPKAHVLFDVGEEFDDKYSGYVKLLFYLRDAVGHGALRVHFISRGDDLVRGNMDFAFGTEVSAINRLGVALKTFAASPKEQIEVML